jgi:peptidyl-prolyl cis-trans isomerase B (cyclophilin B)
VRRLPVIVAACAALSACGGSSERGAATPVPTEPYTKGCATIAQPPAKRATLPKPTLSLDGAKTYVATIVTNCGSFQITLDAKRAPLTGGSFKYLADKQFYDGLTIHRIVPKFVIQGGDPKGTGDGGPGYTIAEPPPKDLEYREGVVAMAKTPDEKSGTSGSQFFVVTGPRTDRPDSPIVLTTVRESVR